MMPFAIGAAGAILVALFLRVVGFDRDRAVYPILMVVIALIYVLFAVIGGSMRALGFESAFMVGFVALAVAGFTRNLWWAVAGLAGHGVFDFFHGGLIANPGMPPWWPAFCGAYDVVFAACLAVLLVRGELRPRRA